MAEGEWEDVPLSRARKALKKEVYDEVEDWVQQGWRLRKQGHAFGLYCPCHEDIPNRSWVGVPGTPRDPVHAARTIRRACRRCPDHPA
mgnify:CR=1 FL=1|jgi:hypothetical protein